MDSWYNHTLYTFFGARGGRFKGHVESKQERAGSMPDYAAQWCEVEESVLCLWWGFFILATTQDMCRQPNQERLAQILHPCWKICLLGWSWDFLVTQNFFILKYILVWHKKRGKGVFCPFICVLCRICLEVSNMEWIEPIYPSCLCSLTAGLTCKTVEVTASALHSPALWRPCLFAAGDSRVCMQFMALGPGGGTFSLLWVLVFSIQVIDQDSLVK